MQDEIDLTQKHSLRKSSKEGEIEVKKEINKSPNGRDGRRE
jgi:hypothetical protein